MTTLVFDIETDGLLQAQRNSKTGAIMPEMTRLWLLIIGDPATGQVDAYSDVDRDLPPVRDGYERLLGADRIVGHNILNFDIPALERFGMPLDYRKAIDTMVLSRLREPSKLSGHSLGVLGEALGHRKGSFSDFGNYSKVMLTYALQDVVVNIEIWKDLMFLLEEAPRAVEVEHVFGWCMSLQMRHGFPFDAQGAYQLFGTLEQEKDDLERSLGNVFPPRWVVVEDKVSNRTVNFKDPLRPSEVAGCPWTKLKYETFNPGSRMQIADRLIKKYGWKPKKFTSSGGPQIDETVLAGLPWPEAQAMVSYFNAQKKLGQVKSWIEAERDGRIYGYINTIGANTHRCSHRSPNVAQVDKDKRMRGLWRASTAMTLVGSDAEGLELRMLGHYLARWDGGAFSRAVVEGSKEAGTDAHTLNMKAAGLYLRDSAKTLIYALIYGAGDAKLGQVVIEDARAAGKPKPVGRAHAIGKVVRSKLMRNIPGLSQLTKAVASRVGQGFLIGLDGRRVHIRSAHSALNTLLQSAGAIVMKWSMLCWWEAQGHTVCGDTVFLAANVHDEQQFETTPEMAEPVGKAFSAAITEAGIRLGVRCPLSGSYDIGPTWADTH